MICKELMGKYWYKRSKSSVNSDLSKLVVKGPVPRAATSIHLVIVVRLVVLVLLIIILTLLI